MILYMFLRTVASGIVLNLHSLLSPAGQAPVCFISLLAAVFCANTAGQSAHGDSGRRVRQTMCVFMSGAQVCRAAVRRQVLFAVAAGGRGLGVLLLARHCARTPCSLLNAI